MKNVWRWIAVIGVAVTMAAGCASSSESDEAQTADVVESDDSTAVETSSAPTTEAPEEDPVPETTDAPVEEEEDEPVVERRDPALPFGENVAYDPDAMPLLPWFEPFTPGAHRTGAVGTPMSFTTTEPLSVQVNGAGFFVVSDVSSRAPDDRDLVFLRVGAFADPTAPNVAVEEQTPWPNDDFRGWLANLDDSVIASDPVETTINGLPAITADLALAEGTACGFAPGQCVGLILNNGADIKALNNRASYRVWIVDQGDEDPLAVIAGIARDEDADWFARADAVLDTVAFDAVEPNPATWLVPGPQTLNALGGIDVVIPDDIGERTNGRQRLIHAWTGRNASWVPITDQPALLVFAERPHDLDGVRIDDPERVLELLADAAVETTELTSTSIDGAPTRVFDLSSENVGTYAFWFSPLDGLGEFLGWDAPAAGRLWLIEHPDRGLMVMSSNAYDDPDELLPVLNDLADTFLETLTFVG